MHLNNVGPAVRDKFRSFGKVRDLRVNKIVRVTSDLDKPPKVIGALMITADGYVRLTSWGVLPQADIARFAEIAQGLSLTSLEA